LGNISRKFKYSKRGYSRLQELKQQDLAFGGYDPQLLYTGATEEYNGITWTNNPTGLNTARHLLGGAGTQTAALGFGGNSCIQVQQKNTMVQLGQVQEFMNTARFGLGGAGTQTSALAFGGDLPPTTGATEQYDGTSWTSTTSMSTTRYLFSRSRNTTSSFNFWW
jgi:hypothetical protein